MNSNTAILVEDVSVHYDHSTQRPSTLKEFAIRYIKKEQEYTEALAALNHISFDVQRGEVYGVIGQNGAGKSTLLKVISGIVKPTYGRVRVWGKMTTLLSVGAGLNKELTGRENIHLYSSLLGRSRQTIKNTFDQIVDFSELEDFIDSPVRTYSSGMVSRLGFAIATAVQPEILLVDEVLGVGDIQFKEKCANVFKEFRKFGTTTLLITHNMTEVKETCNRAFWLHKGGIRALGSPDEVIMQYKEFKREKKLSGSVVRMPKDRKRTAKQSDQAQSSHGETE